MNIIVVESKCAPRKYASRAALICSGFDINICCVSLTLTDTLQYEFKTFNDVCLALVKKKITLLPCAFHGARNAVPLEMRRLLKYFERGFTW